MINNIHVRVARHDDVPTIVRMLADDDIGRDREDLTDPLFRVYIRAFEDVIGDERTSLVVAETIEGTIVGYLQLTFIRCLSYQGGERALVEDVRVDAHHRGQKVGRQMLLWAIGAARRRGCCLVELFVHEERVAARRFYETLGFRDRHSGMRLHLLERR
jgi:GNAT superfamily N-acetyltransferase